MSILSGLASHSAEFHVPLYHVGTLSAGSVRRFSYEGAGLSVSCNPGLWRRCARLGDAPTHRMVRVDGRPPMFCDYWRVREHVEEPLLDWGRNVGLIAPGRVWKVLVEDCETGKPLTVWCASEEEASSEGEDRDGSVEMVDGWAFTQSGLNVLRFPHEGVSRVYDAGFVGSLMATVWVDEDDRLPELDGVWFAEDGGFTADQGVITPHRLRQRWTVSQTVY